MTLRRAVPVIVIGLLLFASSGAGAQGEGPAAPQGLGAAFTYQGRLEAGGGGVSGPCDFQFGLWTGLSAGAQVGVTQTVSALPVSDGLFTARVNDGGEFGGSAFNSDNRYLAIAVRCPDGGGSYTALAPRQEILATPYAHFALAAPWWGLTDVPAGFADGVDDVGSGSFWTLTGNTGTTSANFLGTTDTMTLTLMVSGTTALRLIPTGGAPNVLGGAASNSAAAGITGAAVGGGSENMITGIFGFIGGGRENSATGDDAAIAGGFQNSAGFRGAVGGGSSNTASGSWAAVSGGRENAASGEAASVGGGYTNLASGSYAAVGGGSLNLANGGWATVGGGYSNTASGSYTALSGGYNNNVSALYATAGGGRDNRVAAIFGTVGGGNSQFLTGYAATIGGGENNSATASYATVGGGDRNTASGANATVAGGVLGVASGQSATVSGGNGNTATNNYATVGGGDRNAASGLYATIGGGILSTASAAYATVGGGYVNHAAANWATVAGGQGNSASATHTVVGGGYNNQASGAGATVAGGDSNTASNTVATVGGGSTNVASGAGATVGGGGWNGSALDGNQALGAAGTIGGGWGNIITTTASYATVGGGNTNTASGAAATVPGGSGNTASGDYSFAAGRNAGAIHSGAFVWADSTGAVISSTTANQFVVRASGGVTMYTDTGATVGAALFPGASSWTVVSDRNAKDNFAPVDGVAILNALAGIPIETWNYHTQNAAIRHMGPMAQDFYAAFGLGETVLGISTVDADGVALAAIQGLYTVVQEKDAALAEQQAEIAALQDSLADQRAEFDARLRAVEQGAPVAGGYGQLLLGLLLGAGIAGGAFALGRRGR